MIERHLEELLAADRVERQTGEAWAVRRHHHEARGAADADGDHEIVRDVCVLDEELAAAEPAGHEALERDGLEIERAGLLHEREARDPRTGGKLREEALLLRRASGSDDERRGHHRARHERAR